MAAWGSTSVAPIGIAWSNSRPSLAAFGRPVQVCVHPAELVILAVGMSLELRLVGRVHEDEALSAGQHTIDVVLIVVVDHGLAASTAHPHVVHIQVPQEAPAAQTRKKVHVLEHTLRNARHHVDVRGVVRLHEIAQGTHVGHIAATPRLLQVVLNLRHLLAFVAFEQLIIRCPMCGCTHSCTKSPKVRMLGTLPPLRVSFKLYST
mmetsp:Transcript_182457/g.578208  ORF Transcript_182457/g.578208 Transcript_182457/m.578208 type:complete len:205 (-) Transcript_182457:342-956(-)